MNQLLLSIVLFSTFCAFYGQDFGIPFETDDWADNVPVSPECKTKLEAGFHVCQDRAGYFMNHSSIHNKIEEAKKHNDTAKAMSLTLQMVCCVVWDGLDCFMEYGKKCTSTADQDAIKLFHKNATMSNEKGLCGAFKYHTSDCKPLLPTATLENL